MWNLIRQNRLVDDREKIKVKYRFFSFLYKGTCDAHGTPKDGQGIHRLEEKCASKANASQNKP